MIEDVIPEDIAWFGRVEWVNRTPGVANGHVSPRAFLPSRTGPWIPLTEDQAIETFPARGRVFWHDVPNGAEKGTLVTFHVEPRQNYEVGEREAFQVTRAPLSLAYEVVDLRAWGDERAIRLALTGDGLDVILDTPNVYVRLDDETGVGPFALERTADRKWRLPESDWDDVEARHLLDEHCSPVAIGARQALVLHDRNALGRPVRLHNWTSDQKLAAGLLGRLRKLNRDAVKALGVTDAVYKQYVESYPGFRFQNDRQRDQEAARFQRVEELIRVVESDETLLQAAAEALLAHPRVEQALDEPKREAVDAARREAREAVESELAEIRADVDDARKERDTLAAERDEVQRQIDEAQSQLAEQQARADEQLASIEAALDARLAALAERPTELFAEAAILRAFGALRPHEGAPAGGRRVGRGPSDLDADVKALPDVQAAVRALAQRLIDQGLNVQLAPALVAAFASGRIVVPAGDAAHDVLRLFADAVAGGRLTWIPVAATLSDSSQLLSHYDTSSGRAIRHPAGLLDVLTQAGDEDQLSVVVLEGFDRAPTDYYLDPIVQCYVDAGRGRRARSLPYVGDDGAPTRLSWPSNVLLACLPSGGTSALPPGPTFWGHAMLLDVGDAVPVGQPLEGQLSAVSGSVWREAKEGTRGEAPPFDFSGHVEVSPSTQRTATAFYHSAKSVGVLDDDACRLAFVGAFLPLVTDADVALRAVQAIFPGVAGELGPRARHLLSVVRPL